MRAEFGRATLFLVFACTVALIAHAMVPTHLMNLDFAPVDLEADVPTRIGDWSVDPRSSQQIIDPESSEAVKAVYGQTMSRSYIDSHGNTVMLSLAYGQNQRTNKIHTPEGCYASQGFSIQRTSSAAIELDSNTVEVHRFEAMLGNSRSESVTYWVVFGGHIGRSALAGRATLFALELTGLVPDGIVIRVSSIGKNSDELYKVQVSFLNELNLALPRSARQHLFGVGTPSRVTASQS